MGAGSLIAVSGGGNAGTSVQYTVATSSGLYEAQVEAFNNLTNMIWEEVSSLDFPIYNGSVKQITADASDENLYLINNGGFITLFVPGLNPGGCPAAQGPFGCILGDQAVPHPGGGTGGCPNPTDIAVDEELNVYVVGCGTNSVWVTKPSPSGSRTWGPWSSFAIKGAADLVSIGANAGWGEQGPWVVDANGLTFQVFANGTSAAIARPEWIGNTAHTIGVYGSSNTAMAIGGNSEICRWTSGWNCPFLNGYALHISVQSDTAFVVASDNNLYTYSNDIQ